MEFRMIRGGIEDRGRKERGRREEDRNERNKEDYKDYIGKLY